jgi:uncharacterized protein (DUF488 family)
MHPLYSFGYQGHTVGQLTARAEALNAVVADVRLKPFSRDPSWRRGPLERVLGTRYVWIEALGNLHYKGDGPIVLKDPAAGYARLRALLATQPIILMCMCGTPTHCHRSVIAQAMAAEGVRVQPLSLDTHTHGAAPPLLF